VFHSGTLAKPSVYGKKNTSRSKPSKNLYELRERIILLQPYKKDNINERARAIWAFQASTIATSSTYWSFLLNHIPYMQDFPFLTVHYAEYLKILWRKIFYLGLKVYAQGRGNYNGYCMPNSTKIYSPLDFFFATICLDQGRTASMDRVLKLSLINKKW